MEPIEITVHFNEDGSIAPLHFIWKGSNFRVESTGRHWSDEAGQHMLVMVTSGQFYELLFKNLEGHWFILPVRPDKTVV